MKTAANVNLALLTIDETLYPRHTIDKTHIASLVEAKLAGAALPPIVADRKSRIIVDGVHRWHMYKSVGGEGCSVPVEWRDYKNKKEMFRAAIRYNSAHGKRLNRFDTISAGMRARELGIKDEETAKDVGCPYERFLEIMKERQAKNGKGKRVPLKRTIKHKSGQELTKPQQAANEKLGGMTQLFYVNQVVLLIENDLVDYENEKLVERLGHLKEMLSEIV